MRGRPLLFAALPLFAAGCAEDETAILLTVCTNISRDQADTLQVDFDAVEAHDEVTVAMADVGLPGGTYEVSLRPGEQIKGAFEINASLLDQGVLVVSRRVATRFVAGEDRDIKILLDTSCIERFCGADQTCDKGACVAPGVGNDACQSSGQDGGADAGNCDRDRDQYENLGCGGNDCDDDNAAVHPDAAELCDQIDNDCSGEADDGLWLAGSETYASYATTDEQAPTIGWADGTYGISWRATRHCTIDDECDGLQCVDGQCGVIELRFVAFDPAEGTPATEDQTVLSGEQPFVGEPALSWSGRDWGVVYEDEATGPLSIFFRRVSGSGTPVGNPAEVSFGNEGAYQPALAWSGRSWGAVWSEVVGARSTLSYGQITADGLVSGGAALSSASEDAFSGSIDWGDNQFGIAWISGTGVVWFQLASEQGVKNGESVAVSDPDGFVGTIADVSWAGDGWVIAWEQFSDGVSQIFAARVDPTGMPEGVPRQIVQTGHRAVSPDLAWSGTELALVWADGNEGDAQILLQRMSADAEPQGAPTRMIRSDTARGSRPAVAWNPDGFEYGVVWQDQRLASDTDVWFNRMFCNDGT